MGDPVDEFGPYRLEDLLGRGGMGEVFRAHDTRHDRTVAVKRLAPHLADEPEFQQRFRREAHLVAQLRNPHVVTIHSYGEIDGQLYIDMQFVDGGDLLGLVEREGPLTPARAVGILEQVASALDEAHGSGLVHRDVKPSNVLLDGKLADFCYLADWGITRVTTTQRSHSLTRTGALLGSLTYMAPEQFDGAVTTRSDIYALTCVFFEMITGRRPYAGDGLPVLMHAHMRIPPPRPSEVVPGAGMFDEIITKGMAKEADERYATAGELAAAARRALDPAAERPDADVRSVAAAPTALPSIDGDAVTTPVPAPPADTVLPPRAEPPAPPAEPAAAPAQPTAEGPEPPDDRPLPRRDRRLLPAVAAVAVLAALAVVWGMTLGAGTPSAAQPPSAPSATITAAAPPSTVPPSTAPAPPVGPVLTETIFIGRTSDNELTLAVGIKDGRAVGYLCDGDQVEAWLEGGLEGDRLVLTGRTPENALEATVDARSLVGQVTAGGARTPFSASLVTDEAGLYESRRAVEGITTRIGWIVLPDGTQVGIARTGDLRAPAPPLDVRSLTTIDDGQTVPAQRLSGDSTVLG